jgi:hypothetical protein
MSVNIGHSPTANLFVSENSLAASLATKRPPPALPFRVPRRPKMQRGACLG